MGLRSLQDKIHAQLSAGDWSEANVVYVLVEMGKYMERSTSGAGHLGNAKQDIVIKTAEHPAIRFFRDWAAHTEKTFDNIPKGIADLLSKLLNKADPDEVAAALFEVLTTDIIAFSARLYGKDCLPKLDGFIDSLKPVLAEQPVFLHQQKKRVGFNDALQLHVLI